MGGALRHALTTAVVLVGVLAVPAAPADAVSTGRPIAVAVAADGTSYAGFAAGGRVLRLTPDGDPDGSVTLDRDDPVTALDVDPAGTLWVDYGDSISQLDPADGTLLAHFSHRPSLSCPDDAAHDPGTYGGIKATADAIYVAGRCARTVGVYSPLGDLELTLDLPGSGYPRGIAVSRAGAGVPARLYVSLPDAGKVLVYDLAGLKATSDPVRTLRIEKDKPGYVTPVPGGLAADAKGQLVVTDVANNALYFYDGTKDYHFYRTLGHPPDPAPDKGYLDDPSAIDQAGESLDAHLWVADTGNGRVQRWSTDGTTQWMTNAQPPADEGAPVNTVLPAVEGSPAVGQELTCDDGAWEGDVAAYVESWLRDGRAIGATGPTHTITSADVSTELSCSVVATSATGARSAPAVSDAFPIPGATSPPYVVTRPEISGVTTPGSVLHCSPGTWTDPSPESSVHGWLRDGQLLAGTNAADYLVTASDLYHRLTCRVVASNAYGASRPAVSDAVVIEDGGSGDEVGPPSNDRRPSIEGTATVGSVLFCDPGTWENAPLFSYTWRRDGDAIGGSQGDHHTVVADDRGASLTCEVTGTNPAGAATATSPAVVPTGGSGGGDDDPDDPGTGSTSTCRGRPSVAIDHGHRYARDPYVSLRIRAPRGATGVVISNDASFRHADTRGLTRSCAYPWTLDKRSSRTPKTVWVRFTGASGKASDQVVLDSAAPHIRRITARWRDSWWSWVLTIHASDRGTGIAKVQVGHTRGDTRWVPWRHPVNDVDSSKLRWVRVWDHAGNASGWYRLRI
ncbi:hypothetical protein [Nocardioides mangrovi]|uniref:Ig-like domain-containing protein n=1 Tax=Nocardioides mangrovi TaxID=2874580 RepID=A0ABS7UCI2_9ACTN|nr:hypothetical protein [Nocardioides mangrovi]MBZ5738545.1 hypothetical protein [Nocardioides mangrovi]